MWGNRNIFDPWTYVEQRHPDVRVKITRLKGRVQGCVDVERRIIWLDRELTPVQARCVLAYEIAHLEQGPLPSDPRVARAVQRAAEEWAALMLIPSEMFVAAWANCLSFETMASSCNVDVPTFRARIRAASNDDQDVCIKAIANTRLFLA